MPATPDAAASAATTTAQTFLAFDVGTQRTGVASGNRLTRSATPQATIVAQGDARLEHAAARDGVVRAGDGVATVRIGRSSRLRVVDVILSGTHEAGSSHYELLRAFLEDSTLERATQELDARGYRTHEFGDSVLIL